MYKDKYISKSDLEIAESNLKQAKANLKLAEIDLEHKLRHQLMVILEKHLLQKEIL